jgi:Kdo2-lipid IVA lauroyltransferase/acyltransferase
MIGLLSRFGVLVIRTMAWLPLSWVRALGWLLGRLLYVAIPARRRIVLTNLALCFPEQTLEWRRAQAPQVFVKFAQAWLDRGWLWHASQQTVSERLKLTGATHLLHSHEPLVFFAPHFMGLDAGGTAITMPATRKIASIYSTQVNEQVDQWLFAGRRRFQALQLIAKQDGLKPIANALRSGAALYLLPDMDFGPRDSFFVPFMGVNAATVGTLPRFARLGRARVATIFTRMTDSGYETHISELWPDYPSDDVEADTARMNRELEALVRQAPEQYYWVHKRFKTRPPGEPGVY